jgi:hypothetical protein
MGRLRSNCRWPDNKRFFSTLERIPKSVKRFSEQGARKIQKVRRISNDSIKTGNALVV